MKKVFALCLLFCLLMSGCSDTKEPSQSPKPTPTMAPAKEPVLERHEAQWALDSYAQITLGMTAENVRTIMGDAPEQERTIDNGKTLTYLVKDNGLIVTINNSDSVIKKELLVSDPASFAFYDDRVTKEACDSIEKGTSYEAVCAMLGKEGIEYSQGILMAGLKLTTTTYKWFNNDGSYITASFDSDMNCIVANYN